MDQSVLDLELSGKIAWCAFAIIQILGTIIVMSQVAWPVFAIFVPVTAICVWYQVRTLSLSHSKKFIAARLVPLEMLGYKINAKLLFLTMDS